MSRGALHFGALLLAFLPCVRAFAHGVPPDAFAVLSHDAMGPRAVSISLGVALRRGPQSYQFVCPMAWGDQFPAPVAALADGTIVVGATRGLMLLSDDGSLRPHPDSAGVGKSSDVVRSARGVFALRPTPTGSEVVAVDAQTVRVLWHDTNNLYSLVALDDRLVLLRVNGMMLDQITISAADGTELERQSAVLDNPVDYVYARANAGTAYALIVYRTGAMALGTLRMNVFTKVAEGEVSIAGPLSVQNTTLLALDGALSQLVDGHASPLADDHNIVCLAEHEGLSYACEATGIATVNGQTLGNELFRFDWLVAPNLTSVPEGDDRFYCNQQWADLRLDIQLLLPDFGSTPVVSPMTAGAGAAGAPALQLPAAGSMAIAGAAASAPAAGAPALVEPQPVQPRSSGCAALPSRRGPGGADAYAFGLALLLAVVRCRRRRPRYPVSGYLADEPAVRSATRDPALSLARSNNAATT